MQIEIDGADYSDYFSPLSFDVSYDKVEGPNSGTSIGGTSILDVVKVKTILTLKTGLLTTEKFTKFTDMANNSYVTVKYDLNDTGNPVELVMIPTAGKARQVPLLGGGYVYKNIPFELREK
jgi:hypothetical protein